MSASQRNDLNIPARRNGGPSGLFLLNTGLQRKGWHVPRGPRGQLEQPSSSGWLCPLALSLGVTLNVKSGSPECDFPSPAETSQVPPQRPPRRDPPAVQTQH